VKRLIALATLASIALASPAWAAPKAEFPEERSLGLTLGLIGPGVAYRTFLTPEFGIQFGLNTFWVPAMAVSGGGQVMYSPIHNDGKRFYLQGGLGITVGSSGTNTTMITPGAGVGISSMVGESGTVFLDLTYLSSAQLGGFAFIYPQLGYLFHF
jgi:hypothetical protein